MTSRHATSRITAEPVHLPFTETAPDAPFRWRLGVRPLDLADWFEWGETGDAAVAAKGSIMAKHADAAFAVLDQRVSDEGAELAELVVAYLAEHRPDQSRVLNPELHPLDAVARLVPDDVVLLVERDGRLVFGGGSLCFPNRWDLRSKLGLTMAQVHEPVELLNKQIEGPIDHFFSRLVPERSWWRLGWGIIHTDDWYAPSHPERNDAQMPFSSDSWWLRVERETLRRLPRTGAVAFGIRTHVTPLGDLDADVRSHLAARIEQLPDEVVRYKSVADVRENIIADLRN